MTTYHLSENQYGATIVRVHDDVVSFIPDDPANADWQAYEEWLAEGNSPLPWPPEA